MAIVEAVESSGPRRRLRALAPATLEPIGEFDCASSEDVRAAVERARKAQHAWAELSFEDRGNHLRKLLGQMVER